MFHDLLLRPLNFFLKLVNYVCRVVRIRRMREGNHEAVLLALCFKTFTSKVIIFRLRQAL